jgi:phage minor structural protein
MIPILFQNTETTFTSNGLGRLSDCVRCVVTEERNGLPELELDYPIDGPLADKLVADNIIYATHDDDRDPQPYQIYNVETPLQGLMTVKAWHIAYNARNVIVRPFTAVSCADALAKIAPNAMTACPYTFWTDKAVSSPFSVSVPWDVWSLLGGTQGSILDVYGKGEYEFDKWAIKLWLNRGSNQGVTIRYGKNLTSLNKQIDASNVYNAVAPFWSDMDGTQVVSLDHLVVRTGETAKRAQVLDLSEDFEDAPTTAQLEAKAQSIVDSSTNYEVNENIKVEFVQLWQTEDYKDIAPLQKVRLCDTVNIFYAKAGVNATAKVIKTVYNTLLERYDSMELGAPKTSLSQQITETVEEAILPQVPTSSAIQSAIEKATKLITGGFGGYASWHYLADGTPSELLFMDAASEAEAVNVVRFNKNGIGFSTTGVNGPYRNAWTIDGALNADFITTGSLIANLITAGVISDSSGLNSWDLDNGVFKTKQGQIGSFLINALKLTYGSVEPGATGGGVEIGPVQTIYSDGNSRVRLTSAGAISFERNVDGSWERLFRIDTTLYDGSPVAQFYAGYHEVARFATNGAGASDCDVLISNIMLAGTVRIPVTAKFMRATMPLMSNSISPGQTFTINNYTNYSILFFDAYVYNNSDTRYNGRTTMALTVDQINEQGTGEFTYTMGNSLGTCMFSLDRSGTTLTFKQLSGTGYVVKIKGF